MGTVGLFLIAAYVRHGVVRIASLFGEQMLACCLVVVVLTGELGRTSPDCPIHPIRGLLIG